MNSFERMKNKTQYGDISFAGPLEQRSQRQPGYPYKTAKGSAFTHFVNFL